MATGILSYIDERRGLRGMNQLIGQKPEQMGEGIEGPPRPGSGLLGGQMSFDEFFAQTAGLPGPYGKMGMNALSDINLQRSRNQAAMDRYLTLDPNQEWQRKRTQQGYYDDQRKMQFAENNEMRQAQASQQTARKHLYEIEELERQENERARTSGLFGSRMIKAQEFNKAKKLYRQEQLTTKAALDQAYGVDVMAGNRGSVENWTNVDDQLALTAYNKLLRPNEAMMESDVQQVISGMRLMGFGDNTIERFIKGGKLDHTTRGELFRNVREKRQQMEKQRKEAREKERFALQQQYGEEPWDPKAYFYPDVNFTDVQGYDQPLDATEARRISEIKE